MAAGVDLHSAANNREHRTHEISVQELVVRRGQPFRLTLTLSEPFDPDLHPLTITAATEMAFNKIKTPGPDVDELTFNGSHTLFACSWGWVDDI
ncbi:unnamed protein product [Menidia menidia]|uniref:(Atlantic silverside) hypothetical protein n=1 Tax=Menidia menidia TaxID=238744 RepID=A0A8S4BGA8_9TELE|nr:unnamed protein product [Menidia menidia]